MTGAGRPSEAVLEESAEDLYENAPCGYLSTAPGGMIVKVNRTFLEWTGYRRDELVDRMRFQDLLTPGGRIYHETHYAPLLHMQGTVREIAIDVVRADGSRLPVLLNSVQRRDDAGAPLVTRTTIFNATDRKEYERELLRARERERAARRRVERLQRVTVSLAAGLEPHDIADAVVEALADDLGTVNATFARLDDDLGELVVASHRGSGTPTLPPLATLSMDQPVFPAPGGASAPRAVVPVVASSPLGVLWLEFEEGRAMSDDDRSFVMACAGQAAQALERAKLHEEARDVALTLQHSLLAGEPPRDPRFAVAARYEPGVTTLQVGGDWYDVFLVGEERVAVVVGDVVGRGIEAATTMGQLRSATRALALAEEGPAVVLGGLDGFVGYVPSALMATVAYCEIDLTGATMRYGCAGHPPPALVAPGQTPALLWDGRSPPLGVHAGPAPREEAQIALEPGTRLVLYTDGLVERRGSAIDAGLEQLLAELDLRRAAPPSEIANELTDAMLADMAAPDDTCVLCLLFQPAGS